MEGESLELTLLPSIGVGSAPQAKHINVGLHVVWRDGFLSVLAA
jgi:hypothetical protein